MWMLDDIDLAKKLVLGATVLGTGGGGSPEEGLRMLAETLSKGKGIKIVDISELPMDSVIVVPYYVGSIAPGVRAKKSIKIENAVSKAFEVMEKELGVRIGAVVATELGGANTSVALSIAGELDIPAIDGDLLGRAAPELHQCTVHIFNIPMYPSVLVTETGNIVVIKKYADIDDYEAIARYLSILSGRFSAVVDTPMKRSEAEKAVIKGTLSLCVKIGDAIIRARLEGKNPVEAIASTVNGWIVFKGVVKNYKWRNEGGFLKGEAIIRGIDKFSGKILRSWIMNEHIMVWINDKPLVMPPDIFTLVKNDGTPLTNAELVEGMVVNGIATKAPSIWRTEKGLELFGPRHFGFNYDYIPVEELLKEYGII